MTPLDKKHAKSARPGNGRKMLPGFAGALFLITLAFASGVADANCPVNAGALVGNLAKTPDADFTNGASIVTHTKTGLIWKECVEGLSGDNTCTTGSAATYTWQDALKRAVTAGAGWRLPSRNELLSLVETGCSSNMINTTLFPNSPVSRTFWTSTPAGEGNPTAAWTVRFGDGTVRAASKSNLYYVRLVSGPTTDTNSETYNQQSELPATGPSNTFPLFTAATNQAPGALVSSNTVTLAGITGTVPISIIGGEYTGYNAVTFTNGTDDYVNWTAHGLGAGTVVQFVAGGGLPAGITAGTNYYVLSENLSANAFQISTTPNGAAVSITTVGTAPNYVKWWTNRAGTIGNQSLQVRMVASPSVSTTKLATVTINGRATSFSVTTGAAEPLPVSIPAKINVARNTRIIMNAVQIQGLTASRTASVTAVTAGGTPWLSVGAGATTPADATNKSITNNQYLTTSIMSSTATNTSALAYATVYGYDIPFEVVTKIEPTPLSFTNQVDVPTGSVRTSNRATISGLSPNVEGGTYNPYTVSGGTYQLNATGGFIATGGNALSNGNTFDLQHTASVCPSTTTITTLTINGQQFPFSSTTVAGQLPAAFTFTPQTNVCGNAVITSAPSPAMACLPGGSAVISVANGQYGIGGAGYTSGNGTINNTQTVNAQLTSASTPNTPTTATVTINGNPFTFTATTPTYATSPFTFPDVTGVCPGQTNVVSASSSALVAGTVTVSCGSNAGVAKSSASTTYATSQSVTAGQTVTVRQNAAATLDTPSTIHLSYNGGIYPFTVRTREVDAPTGLSFATKFVSPNTADVLSDTVTINGLCATSPITISSGDGTPEFSKPNLSTFTWYGSLDTNITIANSGTLRLRLDAGGPGVTRTATVTINGNPYTYSVTSYSGPDDFTLTPATAVTTSTVEESAVVTISGLSHPPMTATFSGTSTHNPGIVKSTDGGTVWSNWPANGTSSSNVSVNNGDKIKVRLTAAGTVGTTRTGTLTINGQSFTYTVRP